MVLAPHVRHALSCLHWQPEEFRSGGFAFQICSPVIISVTAPLTVCDPPTYGCLLCFRGKEFSISFPRINVEPVAEEDVWELLATHCLAHCWPAASGEFGDLPSWHGPAPVVPKLEQWVGAALGCLSTSLCCIFHAGGVAVSCQAGAGIRASSLTPLHGLAPWKDKP